MNYISSFDRHVTEKHEPAVRRRGNQFAFVSIRKKKGSKGAIDQRRSGEPKCVSRSKERESA